LAPRQCATGEGDETYEMPCRTPRLTLWQNFLLLAGRVLMGWILRQSRAWRKLTGMDAFIASLVNRRVPYASVLGWIGARSNSSAALRSCSVLDALRRARADRVHVIVATLIGHRYWEITDAAARRMQQSHFWKNVTILGGFVLMQVTRRPGRRSVDGWRRRVRGFSDSIAEGAQLHYSRLRV
jgi:putative oxidoreductase